MQKTNSIIMPELKRPEIKSSFEVSLLQKLRLIETLNNESGLTLMKNFLKELQPE